MTTETSPILQKVTLDNGRITLLQGDCLQILPKIKPNCIDMVFADLPYGITDNKWDSVLPLDKLWQIFHVIGKATTPFVFTANGGFQFVLAQSNLAQYKYDWIWDKTKSGSFATAKIQPMRSHESILVFYEKQCTYNPQMVVRGKVRKKGGYSGSANFNRLTPTVSYNNEYYPTSIIEFSTASRKDHYHPTQKPIELLEYLIKTYTNENGVVLDPTFGCGTTAVACINTNRRFIGCELDTTNGYFQTAVDRCNAAIGARNAQSQ